MEGVRGGDCWQIAGPGSRIRQEAGTGLTSQGPPLVIYFLQPGFNTFKTVPPAGGQALNQAPQEDTLHSTPNKAGWQRLSWVSGGPRPMVGFHTRGRLRHTGAGKDSQGDTWKESWGGTSAAKNSNSHPTLAEVESFYSTFPEDLAQTPTSQTSGF